MAAGALAVQGRNIFQGVGSAARGAIEKLANRVAAYRDRAKSTEIQLEQAEGMLESMARKIPRYMVPVVQVGSAAGAAYGSAYFQELLDERGAGKIGPFDAMPTVGLGMAVIGAAVIPDADMKAGFLAVATGAIAGGAAAAGRQKRKQHKQALDAQKAAQKA